MHFGLCSPAWSQGQVEIIVTFYSSYWQEVSKQAKAEVEEAVEFSLQGSELSPHELYSHIFVDQGDLPVRGCDLFTSNQTTS